MATMHGSSHATGNLTAVPELQSTDSSETDSVENETDATGWRGLRERTAKRLGLKYITKVLDQRERVRKELSSVPVRMQKLTNQATLVLELIDDFRADRYRKIPWTSIAVAGGALLYSVSPGDVIPDFLPAIGQLDDVLVIGIALRVIRKDLRAYLDFKGYDPSKYF